MQLFLRIAHFAGQRPKPVFFRSIKEHSSHTRRRLVQGVILMRIVSLVVVSAQLTIAGFGLAEQRCKSTVVGDLRIEQFDSKLYARSVTVRIWLPPGYSDGPSTTHKYPTLYLFDGQTAFDECTAFRGEHEL